MHRPRSERADQPIHFAKGDAPNGQTAYADGPELRQNEVWLKLEYRHYRGTLSYSFDGDRYHGQAEGVRPCFVS